jgi:hypothetical protein
MTVGKWVSDAGKIDCEIIRPSFFAVESTALDKNAGVIALFDEHLILSGLVARRFFVMSKSLMGTMSGFEWDLLMK